MVKTIIVVEDDNDIQELLQLVLNSAGYNVVSFANQNFIEKLPTIDPCLILMDNQLDGASGADVCLTIKNDQTTAKYPVLILSANSDVENIARDSQANGFLSKPFNIDDLLEKVHKHSL